MEEQIVEQVGEKTADWTARVWDRLIDFALTKGPEVAAALIIAAVGYMICRWIRRVVFNVLTQSSVESSAVTFITELLYFFCLTIVAVMALGTLGFSTTSISAALGGIGLGIGLALKDKISNVASGIFILIFQPFRVGDYIDAGGYSGTVANIRIMHTEVRTTGNQMVIVPNLTMTSNVIVNYSYLDTRNIEFTIGVGYGTDLRQCVSLMRETLVSSEYVLNKEDLPIYVKEFADSSINIYARAEVKRSEYFQAMNELNIRLKEALDQAGIDIPFPQLVVHQAEK